MTFRTRPPALSLQQMHQAADLYREGKSRRQVAAILKASETSVATALRHLGVPMRNRISASAESNRKRIGHYRKTQLVSSVFDLGKIYGGSSGNVPEVTRSEQRTRSAATNSTFPMQGANQ